jgi:quercetin dioxygenase-like cupin family protein
MIEIASIQPREIIKGFHARFIHSQNATIAYWDVEKGAILPMHAHIHEQYTQVLEGKFELTVQDVPHLCEAGFAIVIPSKVRHGGIALTDCKILDIFTPVRTDYL